MAETLMGSCKEKTCCALVYLATIIGINLICYYNEYSAFEISVSVSVGLVVGFLVSVCLQSEKACLGALISVVVVVFIVIDLICYYADYSAFIIAVSVSVGLVVGLLTSIYLPYLLLMLMCLPCGLTFACVEWLKQNRDCDDSVPERRIQSRARVDNSAWARPPIGEIQPLWSDASYGSNSFRSNPVRSSLVVESHSGITSFGSVSVHSNPVRSNIVQGSSLFRTNPALESHRVINSARSSIPKPAGPIPRVPIYSEDVKKECPAIIANDVMAPDLASLSKLVGIELTRLMASDVVMSDYVMNKHFNRSGRRLDEDEAVRISEAREEEQGLKKANTVFDMPSKGFNLYLTSESRSVHISSEPVTTFMCHRNESINNGQWQAKSIGSRYAVFGDGHCLVRNSLRSGLPKQKRSGSEPSRARPY